MRQLKEGNLGGERVIPAAVGVKFLCRSSGFQLFSGYFREVLPAGAGWGLGEMPKLHPKMGDQESFLEVPIPPLRFRVLPSEHKANIYSANL